MTADGPPVPDQVDEPGGSPLGQRQLGWLMMSLTAVMLGGIAALVILLGVAGDASDGAGLRRAIVECRGLTGTALDVCVAERHQGPSIDLSRFIAPAALVAAGLAGAAATMIGARRARRTSG